MVIPRNAILRLYDYLAGQIKLDFTAETPHILGCNGTLRDTAAWIAASHPQQQDEWRAWLRAMCIDCDCALLLQLNTMAADNGAIEGLNMRRCGSCNALLALYQVARSADAERQELYDWAAAAQVPAYFVIPTAAHAARVSKVYPPGETFTLTDRQFYGSILRQLETRHRCETRGTA
jgi:hypothetical protein